MAFIDALKALASQLIVLHHLAFYGPMSVAARPLAPALIDSLDEYGRVAVQAFLVIGGFLAAKALAPSGTPAVRNPLLLVWRRYMRLAVPFVAALFVAIVLSALARNLMHHESIPAPPSIPQVLAHALLLHGLLGYESLSAGVWYVAIDLQLYALMVAVLWFAQCAGPGRRFAPAAVAALAAASLYYFNRNSVWDEWALYFFGAYAMGALAYWAAERTHWLVWFGVLAAMVVTALAIDFRLRIAVALVVALALGAARRTPALGRSSQARPIAFLGTVSYSVFLVHFPVCLVVNVAFSRIFPDDPVANAAGMVMAWGLSTCAGALFHRYVESVAAISVVQGASKRTTFVMRSR